MGEEEAVSATEALSQQFMMRRQQQLDQDCQDDDDKASCMANHPAGKKLVHVHGHIAKDDS